VLSYAEPSDERIAMAAFIWGVGSRVEQPAAGLIQGYPYVGPAEDLKLK
jgi:hypothetical protein